MLQNISRPGTFVMGDDGEAVLFTVSIIGEGTAPPLVCLADFHGMMVLSVDECKRLLYVLQRAIEGAIHE
jgi:hypothetical protein